MLLYGGLVEPSRTEGIDERVRARDRSNVVGGRIDAATVDLKECIISAPHLLYQFDVIRVIHAVQ